MKKIILLCVSFVLLISSLILGVTANGSLSTGVGFGINQRVRNVDELSHVLSFLLAEGDTDANSLGLITNERPISLVSTNGQRSTIDLLASKKSNKKYTSATVTILTSVSAESSCSHPEYAGGLLTSSQSLEREMTMFITKNGTLYHTKGTSNSRRVTRTTEKKKYESYYYNNDRAYDSDYYDGYGTEEIYKDTTPEYYEVSVDNTYYTVFDFDMQILRIGKRVYVNFKEFSYATETESRQIKFANTDKWIEMPYEIVEDMIDVDAQNREVLNSFGEMLRYLIDSGEVDKDENYISLNEEDFVRLYEELEETPLDSSVLDEADIEFTYDLTSPSTPYITSMTSYDIVKSKEVSPNGRETEMVRTTNKASVSQQFIIRNINNTVLSFDRDDVTVKISGEKAYDKLFIIEERRDDNE